jgi:hypothetical protein
MRRHFQFLPAPAQSPQKKASSAINQQSGFRKTQKSHAVMAWLFA